MKDFIWSILTFCVAVVICLIMLGHFNVVVGSYDGRGDTAKKVLKNIE